MKLTFITEHFPPDSGGVATSSKRLAEALVAAGHQVQILTFDKSRPLVSADYVETLSGHGFEVFRFGPFFSGHPDLETQPLPDDPSSRESLRAMFRRRACDRMNREAARFRPDAVLSFFVLNAGFLARFISADLGVPCFVGVRGNDIGLGVFNMQRFAAIHWVLQGAAGVICVNEHLKRRVLAIAPALEQRTWVIENGVPLPDNSTEGGQARRRVEAATNWNAKAFIAVFIGALREKKGVVPLLAAMERLADSTPLKLLVVGPEIGSIDRRLCGSSWDLLIRKGTLYCTGQVDRSEVARWAAGGCVTIMPSLDDGLPNGLLEGMALGLCPVASMLFKNVVRNGETGFLFDQHDPDELFNVLQCLTQAPETAARVGSAARDYVAKYHRPDIEAQKYIDLITRHA